MRILIIRHGDPDYEIDGLTEKGKREAALLAKRLEKEDITAVYCRRLVILNKNGYFARNFGNGIGIFYFGGCVRK